MKRIILLLLSVISTMALTGCMTGVETDYAAAIMVEGEIYLKTVTAIPAEDMQYIKDMAEVAE